MQSNFYFSYLSFFFSTVSSMMLNPFTLVIFSLNCLLILNAIHSIPGVVSSFFFHVSPKNLRNFWYLAYMFCSSFYLLKKFLLVSFKVSIIHYSSTSLNESLKFNHFGPKLVSPALFILF